MAKGEGNEKDEQNKFCFQGLENQKTLRKLLTKEEEEEIQEDVQRDSKDVKDCNQLSWKCKLRTCFYRLFMSGQENH